MSHFPDQAGLVLQAMKSEKAHLYLEKSVLEQEEIDVFYMEGCLPFKEQAPGTLHKFLLFWLNIRRGKTFWCSSEGSTHTSNVSINGKAASPRNNKKYKHGSWLQECHSVESHWLREAPQSRAAGEPQHLPSASSHEASVSWGILGTWRTQVVMLCWFQHPRSKVRGIRTLI